MIPHSKWQGSDKLLDVAMMGLIGLIRLALILAPLAIFHPIVECFATAGLLSGFAYYAGWKWLSQTKLLPITYGGKVNYMCGGGSDWGELFTGAFFGIGIAGAWIYIFLTSPLSWIEQIVKAVVGWF